MAFIERFRTYCGGSRVLAWLLTVTVSAGLLLWLATTVCRLAGLSPSWVSSWIALPADPLEAMTHPWTLVTYMAAHLSPLHLLFNALWLYWFGRMLADVTRERSILVLFAGGGIAGGLIYVFTAWLTGYHTSAVLTGDSAAVLSVMTATAMLMPDRKIGLFLLGDVKLKWVALACILINLLGSQSSGIPPQAAHAAGIAFGLCWALDHKGVVRIAPRKLSVKMTVCKKERRLNARATINAINRSITDEERLDQLLDKIRVSGYDSLTAKEKTELNYISSRIEK